MLILNKTCQSHEFFKNLRNLSGGPPWETKLEESDSHHVNWRVFFDFARQRNEKLILNAHWAKNSLISKQNLDFRKIFKSSFLLWPKAFQKAAEDLKIDLSSSKCNWKLNFFLLGDVLWTLGQYLIKLAKATNFSKISEVYPEGHPGERSWRRVLRTM